MEKIRLDILGLSSSQSQIGSFALVLGEQEGKRRLPIIIGGFEAQAIALEIESIKTNRPMTHDLILSIARSFHIELKEVIISDLKEGVFYSKLIMHIGNEVHEIDARPSDAVAVRYKAPIFTHEFILDEAGIVVNEEAEEGELSDEDVEELLAESTRSSEPAGSSEPDERLVALKNKLEEALNREDYELAARLRDEIGKLERGGK
ncbi:MAG: bifunctional nuclease domain-containing protein [Sphingobacteriia bacterium]